MDCCSTTPWYKEKIVKTLLVTVIVLGVSYFVPVLNPLFDSFMEYLDIIWWAILLGLLLGGIIDYYIPEEYISRYLSQNKKSSIFYATGLGFLMSGCSHGILAIAIQLYKKGASIPSVISFLLAAPWANISITILLFGFFGLKALFLIVSAVLIAIVTGFIYQLLEKKGLIEKSKKVKLAKDFSLWKDLKKRWKSSTFTSSTVKEHTKGVLKGSWSLSKMVLWWIVVGILIAAVANAYVPAHIFHQYLGPTLLGLLLTIVFATILEVCSEGTSPVAFEIFRQTGAFGNSFVFLMAGVATDYTEIGLLWTNIGKKTALWLPAITVPQIVILGYLFNLFL